MAGPAAGNSEAGYPGPDGQPGRPRQGNADGTSDRAGRAARYYDDDFGPASDPGYSALAVSDPAADVTSTQTWQAAGEGRATGVWTVPPRDQDGSAERRPSSGGSDTGALPRRTPAASAASAAAFERASPGPGTVERGDTDGNRPGASADPGSRGSRGHSGAHTSPHPIPRRKLRSRPSAGKGDATRGDRQKSRRGHPASVKLAMATAAVLVLAAAAALSYAVLHHSANANSGASAGGRPKTTPSVSASPSPTLGPYGHIASRATDPTPLTMSQLYPTSFKVGGTSIQQTAANKGTNCAADLVGSAIQSAAVAAHCDQVVRATYVASAQGVMGTIGVLNLNTAQGATAVARKADASDFISQLPGQHGATTKIGQGTGIEEAAAKGHYLILIWAEFTNLRNPRTGAQRSAIEQFMTELLQNTANISLTNRMLTGSP